MARTSSIYDLHGTNRPNPQVAIELSHYLFALSSIDANTPDLDKDASRELQQGLRSLHRELTAKPTGPEAEASRAVLNQLLLQFRERVEAASSEKESDLREILGVLGNAAETLGNYGENNHARLNDFARLLQQAAQADSLGEMRRALTRHVMELRSTAAAIRKQNQLAVEQLQDKLISFQQRLERAELLAATDELTGLLNRREGETRFGARIRKAESFCLLVFDLDRFKAINDKWGHNAGDNVLRSFAKKLASSVRPSDDVCRWGGDEFVVFMDCRLEFALQRAKELRSALAIQVRTVLIGNEYKIPVTASIGVAEFAPGETAEQLFARADAALYLQKGPPSRSLTA